MPSVAVVPAVARDYPEVARNSMYVDAMAMDLVRRPSGTQSS